MKSKIMVGSALLMPSSANAMRICRDNIGVLQLSSCEAISILFVTWFLFFMFSRLYLSKTRDTALYKAVFTVDAISTVVFNFIVASVRYLFSTAYMFGGVIVSLLIAFFEMMV